MKETHIKEKRNVKERKSCPRNYIEIVIHIATFIEATINGNKAVEKR